MRMRRMPSGLSTGMGVDYFGVRMGDVFNQGIHQMLSPGEYY